MKSRARLEFVMILQIHCVEPSFLRLIYTLAADLGFGVTPTLSILAHGSRKHGWPESAALSRSRLPPPCPVLLLRLLRVAVCSFALMCCVLCPTVLLCSATGHSSSDQHHSVDARLQRTAGRQTRQPRAHTNERPTRRTPRSGPADEPQRHREARSAARLSPVSLLIADHFTLRSMCLCADSHSVHCRHRSVLVLSSPLHCSRHVVRRQPSGRAARRGFRQSNDQHDSHCTAEQSALTLEH